MIKILISNRINFFISVVIITILFIPYTSNSFWFDDIYNSQIYFLIQRMNGNLLEFSFHVVKVWFENSGRLMFAFFYNYPFFYFLRDLYLLRISQCFAVVLNIILFGYILSLLGIRIRFLIVWAVILVGLLQINGSTLDPVAGFAFHYQILATQLFLVLLLFIHWQKSRKFIYLITSNILWLFLCFPMKLI